MRKSGSLLIAVAAMLAAFVWPASAKWPTDRNITFICPYPAGTGTDLVARVLAESLARKLGATIIVEDKSGASGSIAQDYVAKARPDGYTFVITTPGPAVNNKLIFATLPYDPLTDFTPIMRLTSSAMLLMAGPKMEANSLQEFIAYAKAHPGEVQIGNPGIGSYAHMTELRMQDDFGVSLNLIQYRGAPQEIPDLLGKQIHAIVDLTGGYLPQIQAGNLRVLAVFGEQRDPRIPNAKTAKEQGVDMVVQPWFGMEGPKGLPKDIVDQMYKATSDILLHDEGVRTRIDSIGNTPDPSTPEEFAAQIKAEMETWRPIVVKYKVKGE